MSTYTTRTFAESVAASPVARSCAGSMVNGQWSMVNGQWSMLNGRWSIVHGHDAVEIISDRIHP